MHTIDWLVLLLVETVFIVIGYLRYGNQWRVEWRMRKLRKDYNIFYSFQGDCKVTAISALDWAVSVQWISRYKILIYDVLEPVKGDLICLRSRATSNDPWVYSWYVLISTDNPGPDSVYMYGVANFITTSHTDQLPF